MVNRRGQYVSMCSWSYIAQPRKRISDAQARAIGAAFLRAKSGFYRKHLPVTVLVQGNPGDPRYKVSQAVPLKGFTYYVRVELDRGGRPQAYSVAAHPREPTAVTPTKLTASQALAIAKQALAKTPGLTVDKVWVVSLSTRSFFAPEGQPVYVVRVNPGTRLTPDSGMPYKPRSFDWGVHATTGKVLTKQTTPPEYYAPRSARSGTKAGPNTQPHTK
jgi:hypothetical protein